MPGWSAGRRTPPRGSCASCSSGGPGCPHRLVPGWQATARAPDRHAVREPPQQVVRQQLGGSGPPSESRADRVDIFAKVDTMPRGCPTGRTNMERPDIARVWSGKRGLLGFAIGVHRGFLDQCVEPTRARRPASSRFDAFAACPPKEAPAQAYATGDHAFCRVAPMRQATTTHGSAPRLCHA